MDDNQGTLFELPAAARDALRQEQLNRLRQAAQKRRCTVRNNKIKKLTDEAFAAVNGLNPNGNNLPFAAHQTLRRLLNELLPNNACQVGEAIAFDSDSDVCHLIIAAELASGFNRGTESFITNCLMSTRVNHTYVVTAIWPGCIIDYDHSRPTLYFKRFGAS